MTNVAVFSMQPILVAGLQALITEQSGLALWVPWSDAEDVIRSLAERQPDVLLIDMTANITLSVIHDIRSVCPKTPMILWVETVSIEFVSQVIGLGVRGILRKSLSIDLQLKCLERVAAGELWVEKALSDQLLSSRRVVLTPRERQLMALLAQGCKNKEIAFSLQITEGTVKVYLSRLFQKTGASDRLELALFAVKNFSAIREATGGQAQIPMKTRGMVPPRETPYISNFVALPQPAGYRELLPRPA